MTTSEAACIPPESVFDEQQVRYHVQLLQYLAGKAAVPGKLILAAYGKADDGETHL